MAQSGAHAHVCQGAHCIDSLAGSRNWRTVSSSTVLAMFNQMYFHSIVCFIHVPRHSAARAHAVNKGQGASDTQWTAGLRPKRLLQNRRLKQIDGVSPAFLKMLVSSNIVSMADCRVHVLCARRQGSHMPPRSALGHTPLCPSERRGMQAGSESTAAAGWLNDVEMITRLMSAWPIDCSPSVPLPAGTDSGWCRWRHEQDVCCATRTCKDPVSGATPSHHAVSLNVLDQRSAHVAFRCWSCNCQAP